MENEIIEVLKPIILEKAPKMLDALILFLLEEIKKVDANANANEYASISFLKNPKDAETLIIAIQKTRAIEKRQGVFLAEVENKKVLTAESLKNLLVNSIANNPDVIAKIIEKNTEE